MSWRYRTEEIAADLGAQAPERSAVCTGVSTDTRTIKAGDVFFALSGPNFDGNKFVDSALAKGAVAAVTSAAGSGVRIIVPDPLKALQQFAARHRSRLNVPVLAITGSCGKTSTKDMAAAVLGAKYNVVKTTGNLNNEIGCPLSLLQMTSETEFAVIEMGANHAGEIRALCAMARPTEAAITLVAPAHLEGFGSVENVARAKAEIVESLPADGAFYVNADDEHCVRIAETFSGEKIYFGRRGDVALTGAEIIAPGKMRVRIEPLGELVVNIGCRAHAMNVLLAAAIGLRHGVDDLGAVLERSSCGSARFKTTQVGDLTVIDDSYNANPASMRAALEALAEWPTSGRRYAALGEMLELGEAAPALHRDIGACAGSMKLDCVYVVGEHAVEMASGAQAAGAPAEIVDDPSAIAGRIAPTVGPGDVLLVKGSRGMKMERVIDALRARLS